MPRRASSGVINLHVYPALHERHFHDLHFFLYFFLLRMNVFVFSVPYWYAKALRSNLHNLVNLSF